MNRPRIFTFWQLQITGWSTLFFVIFFKVSLDHGPSTEVALYGFIVSFTGLLISLIARIIFKKANLINKPLSTIVFAVISLAALFSFIIATFTFGIFPKLMIGFFVPGARFPHMVNYVFIALLWSTLYFLFKYFYLIIDANQKQALMLEQVKIEKLKVLRFQLKPHFLYNVLNSLHYLIRNSPDKAREMTLHLAKYFQHILSEDLSETVSLKNEIGLIEEFIELQKIRYEDKLESAITCPESLMDHKIPGLIIFPIIENAVKYGYNTHDGVCSVNLFVDKKDTNLNIVVENDGKWVKKDESKKNQKIALYEGGIGLVNIRKRLLHHFKDNWTLTHKEEDGKVIVTLIIPSL
ncbi:MAG: histidine kinase [Candidatus Marinimicrobia bacterium]|nr:histidine kinase [Candidatus Neomarinimicrobiota bacterium]MBT3675623.1 histidine kinase [Candidatus Neomarinimicrobiota bacterium]MBT3762542.1 histidine kinase [Candidatus Neomarinimicrobiota bacterium]MBT4067148.1 histidine kinase [Candidatus Neomarinimicrobiota bacterium]MBT4270010.1 histidine kinase [Candidatus Neomarinimicrobiota bacterium]